MLEVFLKYLTYEKRYSPHTVSSYAHDLQQFSAFLTGVYGPVDWPQVTHQHVRSWMVALHGEGITGRSINRKISALQTFFKFLRRQGKVEKNPLQKVVTPKIGKRLPVYVQEPAIDRLFNSVNFRDDLEGCRDRLILQLLYGTGMRRAELIGLKLGDIDQVKLQLKVLGKGNKERIIPFGPEIKLTLQAYLPQRQEVAAGHDRLLVTKRGLPLYPKGVHLVVEKYLGLVTSLEKKSPHVLRHTFATHLANRGAELNAIKDLLGHANLSATQVYTHNSIEQLKKIYEAAHPKS